MRRDRIVKSVLVIFVVLASASASTPCVTQGGCGSVQVAFRLQLQDHGHEDWLKLAQGTAYSIALEQCTAKGFTGAHEEAHTVKAAEPRYEAQFRCLCRVGTDCTIRQ